MANDYLGQAGLTALIAKIKTAISTAVSGLLTKSDADGYYQAKGNIPKSDLASDVQTSLGKADTALQSFTETDPTVPSWAKASSKPTYTASEVGAATSTDITNAINALDVSSVGGSGKYITTISETNGKISATSADFPAIPDVSGKVSKSGDTMTGVLSIKGSNTESNVSIYNSDGDKRLSFYWNHSSDNRGLWDEKKGDWIVKVDSSNGATLNGNAATATTASFANFSNKGSTSSPIDFNSTTFFTKIGMSVGQTLTFKTNSASSGSYCTNPPVGGWIMCIASYLATNYGWVIVIGNGATDNIYKRFLNNGTWGSWQRIVHMGNSTSAVGSSSQPVYVNANGQVTACGDLVAASAMKDGKGNNIYNTYEKKATSKYHVKGKINGNLYETINIDITTAIGTDSNTIYFVK